MDNLYINIKYMGELKNSSFKIKLSKPTFLQFELKPYSKILGAQMSLLSEKLWIQILGHCLFKGRRRVIHKSYIKTGILQYCSTVAKYMYLFYST